MDSIEFSSTVTSRRAFLRRFASASALAVAPRWVYAARPIVRPATLYVTDGAEKYAVRPPLRWSPAASGVAVATIEVDSSSLHQPILGFGAALTDASCFLMGGLPAASRHAFLTEIFSPMGLNLNVGRCCIGSSDYSRETYCYDNVPGDKDLEHFSLKHDEACILPTLREIRGVNPDLFLLASPWSPPGWMKTYGTTFGGRTTENYLDPYGHYLWEVSNGSMLGGWMSEEYLDVYARYLGKFVQGYAQAGVPVHALTTQNEVVTTQQGRMPACRWSPHLEAAFVRDHLGPLLRSRQEKTQIWVLDHNYDFYERVASQLQDKKLAEYVDGVAWHGYEGTPDQMSRLHAQDPNLPFYWTEGGPFIDDPNYATDWTRWGGIFTDALENWCRCTIAWNLMLDSRGEPNIGPYTCGGLVTLKDDGSLMKSGQYHAIRHFSQHLQRNSRRIASQTEESGLRHLAVENPDGSFAMVLTNPGEPRNLRVIAGGEQVLFSLPHNSIATLAW